MLRLKTIIFNLDGTLIHSAPDLQAAVNVALGVMDRGPLDLQTIVSFIGDGVEKLVERSLQKTGSLTEDLYHEALGLFLKSYTRNTSTLTQPYPGVVPFLEELRAAGISLGICTNKPTQTARDICDQLELTRFFKVIAGAEPYLAKKPDPSSLLGCLAELEGIAASSLYVGDSAVDYETSLNAHVRFRLYAGGYLNADLPGLSSKDRFDDWAVNGILDF
jgi:phosphoglycolate phosphatase